MWLSQVVKNHTRHLLDQLGIVMKGEVETETTLYFYISFLFLLYRHRFFSLLQYLYPVYMYLLLWWYFILTLHFVCSVFVQCKIILLMLVNHGTFSETPPRILPYCFGPQWIATSAFLHLLWHPDPSCHHHLPVFSCTSSLLNWLGLCILGFKPQTVLNICNCSFTV